MADSREAEKKNDQLAEETVKPEIGQDEPLDDEQTDKAVEDIQKHEGDAALEAGDGTKFQPPKRSWYRRFFGRKKVWIPLAIIALLIIIFAIPLTRYDILGLFLKQTYALKVTDGQTGKPVSDASVSIGSVTATTDNQGDARLKSKVGKYTLTITKKYYATATASVLVGLKQGVTHPYHLHATGRQVPLSVVNKISGRPVSNATISAAGTTAKTDKDGKVTMVLPADKTSVAATVSGDGFNKASVTIQVTAATVPANTFALTPSGKVYFLSNASGKIDVISTNLDDSNRQTVLVGTGYEDPHNTTLLASHDWKYLALKAKRDSKQNYNALYLINTSNGNKLTTIDEGNANFTPIGWSDHYFLYDVSRNDVAYGQNSQEALKSYNADTGEISVLDQSLGKSGTDDGYYTPTAYQNFSNFYIFGNKLFYTAVWTGDTSLMNGQTSGIRTVPVAGQSKATTLKSYDVSSQAYYFSVVPYDPQSLHIQVSTYNNGVQYTYLDYENGAIHTASSEVTAATFNQASPTYLESPSGNLSFWGEQRDGKTTMFVGNNDGSGAKQIAGQSDYTPYGWYSDSYVLVEKSGSELYIMPASGGTALKISDYFKSVQSFSDYGGL